MEFLTDYGLFLAKAVTIVVVVAIIMGIVANIGARTKKQAKGHIEVTQINEQYQEMHETLQSEVLDETAIKKLKKIKKLKEKADKKSAKTAEESQKRIFVMNFDGDIHATAVSQLRESITTVLAEATKDDEVVLCLESGGGAVHSYGLAASQLDRIRKNQIPLTICVDKVAASGGYMMACVADKIVAAPFSMIGSIGVLGQLPNFNRLLKKHDIDWEQHTAGEFKRTLTMLGENTEQDREKFQSDLEDIHQQFKAYVADRRPSMDIDKVATGEVWLGNKAMELGLVDEVSTSDEYLFSRRDEAKIFEVNYEYKKKLQEKLGFAAGKGAEHVLEKLWSKLHSNRFFS